MTQRLAALFFICACGVTDCALPADCRVTDVSCSPQAALLFLRERYPQVSASPADGNHALYLFVDGRVRAWGSGANGKLGYNDTQNVGDAPARSIAIAGDVPLGGLATQLSAGDQHSCALLQSGAVRCWGANTNGQLGYNNTISLGGSPAASIISAGDVPLGGTAVQVAAGYGFSCALLTTGSVRCWGYGNSGRTGYNIVTDTGTSAGTSIINSGDLAIGGPVKQISAGLGHACALLTSGAVRCWGAGGNGQLGHNNTANVGDTPGTSILNAGDIPVGESVVQIAAGRLHTCALLVTGAVRCWGDNPSGQLGYNSITPVATNAGNSIINTGDVPIGGIATQIATGDFHTCALLTTGAVRCWGDNAPGQLGYNSTTNVGNSAAASIINAGDVPVGGRAVSIAAGGGFTCAVLATGATRCWGGSPLGQLGYNSTANVGNSPAASILNAGDVPVQ